MDSEEVFSGQVAPPLLNRFEKQYLGYKDLLTSQQLEIADEILTWTDLFVDQSLSFKKEHAFLGYNEDNIYAMTRELSKLHQDRHTILLEAKKLLLWTGLFMFTIY